MKKVIEADDPEPPPIPAESKSKMFKKPIMKRMPISDGPPPSDIPGPSDESAAGVAGASAAAATDAAKKGGPKVPNFGRLQKRVMWVGLAAFLIVSYLGLMYLFTGAKVTLYATGTKVEVDTTFAVDPTLKTTDQAKAVLAGQLVTISKDLNGPFTPTGKKDVGTKASGTITVYNKYDTSSHALVAGTRFQAPDGKIFRSKADSSVPGVTLAPVFPFTPTPGKSDPIPVEADQAGDSYNEAPATYTIPGYSGAMQANIYGQGAQMSGGTTRTATIVAQSDVDTEKAALLDKDKDNSTRDLQARVPSGFIALPASQTSSVDSIAPSPAVRRRRRHRQSSDESHLHRVGRQAVRI